MSPYEFKARAQKEEAPSPKRQSHFAIDCIAFYQLLKGGLLLFAFMEIWSDHQDKVASGDTRYDPIALHSSLFLLPILALIFAIIAWGLWKIKPWARVAPIFLFCVIAIYWWNETFGGTGIPWLYRQPDFAVGVVLIECTTFAVLFMLPEAVDLFSRSGDV